MNKLLLVFEVGSGKKSELNLVQLEEWISLLIRAAKQEKETEIDQLPLELAVIDFINKNKGFFAKQIEEKSDSEVEKIEKIIKTLKPKKDENKEVEDEVLVKKIDENNSLILEVTGIDLDKIIQSWGNILLAIKPINHSVEAFLRAAKPIKFVDRKLILEVFYPFHKDRLEEPKNKKIVEAGLFQVLGVELIFDCVLGKSRKAPLIIQNDTPVESVSEQLVEKNDKKEDLYDVAKDIFG